MTLSPQSVMTRLDEIDADLAARVATLERSGEAWFKAKRDKEKARATAFLSCEGTVAERSAHADAETATNGRDEEAEWEAVRAVVRVLETRANIGMALLKSYGRGA